MLDESLNSELYRAVFEHSGDAIVIRDGEQFIDCNAAAIRMLRLPSKDAFVDARPADFSPPRQPDGQDSYEKSRTFIKQALRDGCARFDWVQRDNNGDDFECEVWLIAFDWEGKRLLRSSIRDISTRKEVERHDAALNRAYFESLFNSSPEGIIIVDDQDVIVDANAAFQQLFQYRRDELVGRYVNDCIVPDHLGEQAYSVSRDALEGSTQSHANAIRLRKDGTAIHVSILGASVRLDNRQLGICGIYRDRTAEWEAAERVLESEQQLRRVVGNLPVVLLMFNVDGVYTLTDGAALQAIGRRAGDSVGQSIFEVYPEDTHVHAAFRAAAQGQHQTVMHQISNVVFETRFTPIYDSTGKVTSILGLARDVTETLEYRQRLEHMAHTDRLTGLPNRFHFQALVEAATRRARRNKRQLATLFIDLDGFKRVNDSLGHAVGDRILRVVAERFSHTLRENDPVACMGGDEFAVLVENINSPQDAVRVADKLLMAVAEPIPAGNMTLNMSASIGISLYTDDGADVETLLANANVAMYEAKVYRNTHRFFSPGLNENALDWLMLGNQMHKALDNNEFVLYYQPVVDVAHGTISGFEALIRWQHPERGLVPPTKFVPLAEETGLITALGDWVAETACRQAKAWLDAGYPPSRMAINVSAKQFHSGELVARICKILDKTGLPPDLLLIEITESMMFPRPEYTHNVLQQLRDMNIAIAIDDFGTGYSSLAYLRDFPIDYLKIDRSFIDGVPHDESACGIIETIIAMARFLKLHVIAEGIETDAQWRFIQEHACEEVQGYYFSKPVSAAQASLMVAHNAHDTDETLRH